MKNSRNFLKSVCRKKWSKITVVWTCPVLAVSGWSMKFEQKWSKSVWWKGPGVNANLSVTIEAGSVATATAGLTASANAKVKSSTTGVNVNLSNDPILQQINRVQPRRHLFISSSKIKEIQPMEVYGILPIKESKVYLPGVRTSMYENKASVKNFSVHFNSDWFVIIIFNLWRTKLWRSNSQRRLSWRRWWWPSRT